MARPPRMIARYALGVLCGLAAVALAWTCIVVSPVHGAGRRDLHTLSTRPPDTAPPAADSPLRPVRLAAADLAFGEQQVERMVHDRPEMARAVRPTDAVWQYCVRAFAGGAAGRRVYWDGGLPDGAAYLADHQAPGASQAGRIRVRGVYAGGVEAGRPLPCEQLWSCAVYELENMRGDPAFSALYERALRGEMSRAQWVRENTQLEYQAYRRTARVYAADWLPLARSRALPVNASDWGVDVPGTYDSWIAGYQDPHGYPWDCWGRYYDTEIAPYLATHTAEPMAQPTAD